MIIQDPLDKAIVTTLNYADFKLWPLTAWEVFCYLINPARTSKVKLTCINFYQVKKRLKKLDEKGIVSAFQGFYALHNTSSVILLKKRVTRRKQKDKLTDMKIKKAKKRTYWLRFFPFIRGIFLSGSLVFGWANQKSDIDLLIIVKRKRLWTTRFLLSIILIFLGLKRSQYKVKDRLCLNHFITDDHCKIPLYSIYNGNTYARIVPLIIYRKTLEIFLRSNQWIKKYLFFGFSHYYRDLRSKNFFYYHIILQRFFEAIFELLGGFMVEKLLKILQIRRIKKDPLTYKRGGRVVANNMQIEFHPDSPELKTIHFYNKNLARLNLFSFKREQNSGLS
jgi:predicted nucleotidyltransferase